MVARPIECCVGGGGDLHVLKKKLKKYGGGGRFVGAGGRMAVLHGGLVGCVVAWLFVVVSLAHGA